MQEIPHQILTSNILLEGLKPPGRNKTVWMPKDKTAEAKGTHTLHNWWYMARGNDLLLRGTKRRGEPPETEQLRDEPGRYREEVRVDPTT